MGYRTHHQLSVDAEHEVYRGEHMQKIAAATGGYGLELWTEECKWYHCTNDMIAYSKLWPDTTFIIDGQGEEATDIWRSWFKNGQARHWSLEVIIPEEPLEPFA